MALLDALFHDGKTYDGKELRILVEAVTNGRVGVFGPSTSLAVAQQASPASTVKVAAGTATVDATGAGLFGNYVVANDADLTSPIITATGGSVRTDRLILRVTAGVAALEVVAGTSGSASPPTVTGDNFLHLAQIVLPVSTTNITNAMIVDERVFVGGSFVATSATRPAAPFEGMAIYETDTNRGYVWTGAAWTLAFSTEAWITPTLTNSWVATGGSLATPQYRLEPGGIVRIRGSVKDGTIGQAAFTLNAGYRPPADLFLPAVAGGNVLGRVDITSAGVVQPTIASNTFYSLDCTFSTT